ncbi:MAG: ribonuclease HI family protein [Acidobacteriaceae bacterium]
MSPQRSSGNLFGVPPGPAAYSEWITAFCDGGSRGNPGPAGYGVYIEGPDGEKLAELSEYLGKTTNNVAEYSGLLAAVDYALREGRSRLRIVSDSELMVKQIKGQYKVNSADLRPLYEEAKRRIARLDMFRIEHVLRGKNQRADRLANLAMDRGMGRNRTENSQPQNGISPHPSRSEPPKTYKGFTKGGVVHLIEGELPDGVFVRVIPDRQ